MMNITNLILVAVLSNCTEFARKLELPLDLPLTTNQIRTFRVYELYPSLSVWVTLTNDYRFDFTRGRVYWFEDPMALQRQFPTTNHFGRKAVMTQAEALALAKESVTKLGYSPDDFYMELDPEVKQLFGLPHYEFTWYEPHRDSVPSISIEIDAASGRVVYWYALALYCPSNPDPDIPGLKELVEADRRRQVARYFPGAPLDPPKVEDGQILEVLPKIKAFAQTLALPIKGPESLEEVQASWISYQMITPDLVINLTNGYQFIYDMRLKRVDCFVAKESFFFSRRVRLRDFTGEWKMSEKAAIALVTNAVGKLGYKMETLFRQKPVVEKPNIRGKIVVPRYRLTWEQGSRGVLERRVCAEVDADAGRLVSLSIVGD